MYNNINELLDNSDFGKSLKEEYITFWNILYYEYGTLDLLDPLNDNIAKGWLFRNKHILDFTKYKADNIAIDQGNISSIQNNTITNNSNNNTINNDNESNNTIQNNKALIGTDIFDKSNIVNDIKNITNTTNDNVGLEEKKNTIINVMDLYNTNNEIMKFYNVVVQDFINKLCIRYII